MRPGLFPIFNYKFFCENKMFTLLNYECMNKKLDSFWNRNESPCLKMKCETM